jgi:ppGpp synthetase/RelA/SpoT-type nucleotidyltranferase
MSKKKNLEISSIENEYKSLIPVADRFCKEVKNQLDVILSDLEIKLGFPVHYRIKTWDSLLQKIDRVQLRISSVKNFQDLVGFRIILLFKDDIEKVIKALSEHFYIVKKYNTQERLKEDQFGYSSIHVIIKLPEKWLLVPTFKGMSEIQAEIQIRTLAQHIWAEASHVLQYKQEESVPSTLLRSIYRVSALLETVDLEFERVLEQKNSYRQNIDISSDDFTELNVDLLEKTLDILLPIRNKSKDEQYSEIISELNHFGINTLQNLKELVNNELTMVLETDRKTAEYELIEYQHKSFVSGTDRPETLVQGFFFNHTGLIRMMIEQKFGYSSRVNYWKSENVDP